MLTANAFFSMAPERISADQEARFFGQLKTGNDTFKRTEPGRLERLDSWLIEHVRLADASISAVLDVGISSGITTLEMAHALKQAGLEPAIIGTDRSFQARLIELAPYCRVLMEPGGYILQYEVAGRAIQPWLRRLDYVDGMIFIRTLLHLLVDREAKRRSQAGEGRAVRLLSPRLLQSGLIELVENDITVQDPCLQARFDLVRAANILNRHYFSKEKLKAAVDNVRSYLRGPGSWLLVTRTAEEGGHDASLMRVDSFNRLHLVARYGKGSEVEAMFAG